MSLRRAEKQTERSVHAPTGKRKSSNQKMTLQRNRKEERRRVERMDRRQVAIFPSSPASQSWPFRGRVLLARDSLQPIPIYARPREQRTRIRRCPLQMQIARVRDLLLNNDPATSTNTEWQNEARAPWLQLNHLNSRSPMFELSIRTCESILEPPVWRPASVIRKVRTLKCREGGKIKADK